jgi:hypothetical protein
MASAKKWSARIGCAVSTIPAQEANAAWITAIDAVIAAIAADLFMFTH